MVKIKSIFYLLFTQLIYPGYSLEPLTPNASQETMDLLEFVYQISGKYNIEGYNSLLKLAEGKPIALGEVGHMPTVKQLKEQPKWTWFMT